MLSRLLLRTIVAASSLVFLQCSQSRQPAAPATTSVLPPEGGSATIGAAGGSIATSDGAVSIVVPAGALAAATSIRVAPAADVPAMDVVGTVYEIGADGVAFAQPVTVSISYRGQRLPEGVDEASLELATADGTAWAPLAGRSIDTSAKVVSGETTRSGKHAMTTSSKSVTISPAAASLTPGATVQLTAVTQPANKRVAWTSFDPAIATVDAEGLVTGLSPGVANIEAKSGAVRGYATINVVPHAPALTSPASGTATTDPTVAVSGNASANAYVTILDGSTVAAAVIADAGGSFSTSLTLAFGTHSLSATQTVNGQTSAASEAVSIDVDPGAPAIVSPTDGTATTATTVAVFGTATPGAGVGIFDGDSLAATVTADGSGSFSASVPLAIGVHSVTARQTVNGRTSAASAAVSVTVKPVAPLITSPANDSVFTSGALIVSGQSHANASVAIFDGGSAVATAVADDAGSFWASVTLGIGAHSLSATQTVNGQTSAASGAVVVAIRPLAPAITSPADGTSTTDGTMTVSGVANANALVTIFDGNIVAVVTADQAGTFAASITLAVGMHSLSATQTVNGQTSAASAAVSVEVRPLPPPPPSITSPADGTSTSNGTVTVSGTANPHATVALLEGGTTVATATADGAGSFSAEVTLAVGTHTLRAIQSVNGQTSGESAPVSITVTPSASSWSMFGHDAFGTGATNSTRATTGASFWTSAATLPSMMGSPVTAADGTVYVATSNGGDTCGTGGTGVLQAVDGATGATKWSYSAAALADIQYSTPAVAADGTVYVSDTAGKLFSVGANGSLNWSFNPGEATSLTSACALYGADSVTIGPDGALYYAGYSGKVIVVDPSGALRWKSADTGNWITGGAAVDANRGIVYAGNPSAFHAFRLSDGTTLWSTPVASYGRPTVDPSDGTVYVPSFSGVLYAFGPDGATRWSFTGSSQFASSAAIAAHGTVVAATLMGTAYGLDRATGAATWSTALPVSGLAFYAAGVAIDGGGVAYLRSKTGKLFALGVSDGAIRWSADAAAVYGAPAIGADGTVYVAGQSASVQAFR